MYSVGDYVVKVNDGVCHIEEITHLQMSGVANDKLYYLMVPIQNKGSRIFMPVEGRENELRFVIAPEQVNDILDKISSMETKWIDNNKLREAKYKEVLQSGDLECMIGYIKEMHRKRREREVAGKKNTALDERYLRFMEEAVYSEMAFSLGCERVTIKERVLEKFL